MTRTERITDLLAITSRLIACMEREIGFLRAMRTEDLHLLQMDKASLAEAYEAHIKALRAPGDENIEIDASLRDELALATERFQAVVAENVRALRAVRDVSDRVMRAVAAAVEEKRAKPAAYGAVPAFLRRSAPATSITLDTRL